MDKTEIWEKERINCRNDEIHQIDKIKMFEELELRMEKYINIIFIEPKKY